MRPIDADAVIDCVDADIAKVKTVIEGKAPYYVGAQMMYIAREVKESIKGYLDKAPTLDYEPVRHGEFERLPEECIPNYRFNPVFCKTCNTTFATINKEGKRCTCCPYCGAKMDGGKSDGRHDAEKELRPDGNYPTVVGDSRKLHPQSW